MKVAALRVFGWLALIGGVFLSVRVVASAPSLSLLDTSLPTWLVVAMLYLISGIAVWALFNTVADIAERTESLLEEKRNAEK